MTILTFFLNINSLKRYICRYLAGGAFFEQYVASLYRISPAASSNIIRETCKIIYEELAPTEFMQFTKENWAIVSNEFYSKWNMPNCLGAIDGKHIKLKCPPNAGSLYYNYKVISFVFLF